MKTIFLSSFHTLISRNILAAGVLTVLLERGVRVVLLVPKAKVDYFKDTFGSERVVVESVEPCPGSLDTALQFLSLSLVGVENHIVRGWKTEGRYLKYYAAHAIHRLCAPFFIWHRLFRMLARTYLRTSGFDNLLTAYKPDLVVATDSFDPMDRLLLLEAKRAGVPSVGMIRSWDNATTKGVFLPEPEYILVPNEVLKEEMHAIHKVPLERIVVVGVPHYDRARQQRALSKEQLFAEVGLDPNKKTLFYSPGGKILYKHDAEMLALIKKHLDRGAFVEPVQFLVSIQPGDTIDTSGVASDPNFIVYTFGTNVTGRRKENEIAPEENERLSDFLHYSDIVLTLVSTMAIDGMVFDKPVIVLGFDPKEGLPDKVAKFAKYKHFEKFLGTGLVTVSRSEDEFVEQVNAYLIDPTQDRDEREALLERYVYRLDGHATRRVAEEILRHLN